AGDGRQQREVGGGVHGRADQRLVVQVQATDVEGGGVTAQGAGHDPPAALAQVGQPFLDLVARDHVECGVQTLGGELLDFGPEVPAAVDRLVGACFSYGGPLSGAGEREHARAAR